MPTITPTAMPDPKSNTSKASSRKDALLINSLMRILSKADSPERVLWSDAQIQSLLGACAIAVHIANEDARDTAMTLAQALGTAVKKEIAASESEQVELLAGLERRVAQLEKKTSKRATR